MTIYLALLVAIVGAILVLICPEGPLKPKFGELGKWAWLAGLIVFLYQYGVHNTSLLR